MNDTNFVNYDNYFCTTTSSQMTDVNPLIQTMDYDMPQTIHYINNVSCDMAAAAAATAPLSQTTSIDQRHQQQTNLFTFLPHATPREEQEKHENQSTNLRGGVNNNSSIGTTSGTTSSSSNVFGNIPFVQIHTTNVQPQRTSYGNVFRRNISKQDEIKSEPIKSENADAAKERTNATPTPPRAPSQAQNENNMEVGQSNVVNASSNNDDNMEHNSSASLIQIYKCSKCPYLSLSETDRNDHTSKQHGESDIGNNIKQQEINCPGCSNIFFIKQSLEIHLKLDHLMSESDVLKLSNSLIKIIPKESQNNTKSTTPDLNNQSNMMVEEPQRKSRIYLKNVECLREPNRQPMEQTENQLCENICGSAETPKPSAPKQKISIKSVDVLREPALLRRDYEMQKNYLNFNTDMINNSMDIINNPIGMNVAPTFDYGPNLDGSSMNNSNNCNNNDAGVINSNINNGNSSSNTNDTPEKPRRPKIYVKSVESFNLMPLDTIHSNNNNNNNNSTGFLNDHSNLCNSAQVYDSNMVHLPFMFDSNTSNNTNNFISNHNDLDSFQYITNSNQNNNFILENSLFLNNNEDDNININSEQMENITLIPEPTPTPPIISDMNLMNKPPHPSHEQRGTLHLRTVDELNLMNKNEVQHLIAPNLDNNHNTDIMDKNHSTSLNDINIIGAELYEDDNFKFDDLDTQMVNDWPEAYEDLAEDINGIIADASNDNNAENLAYAIENSQKISNNFDIDTPQVSLITIRDIEELTGTSNQFNNTDIENQAQELIFEQIQDNDAVQLAEQVTLGPDDLSYASPQPPPPPPETENNLKRELSNATPESNEVELSTNDKDSNNVLPSASEDNCLPSMNDLPPLVPVTNTTIDITTSNNTHDSSDIPLPPLVPVSSMVKKNTNLTSDTPATTAKGRIYVANNLMEPPKPPSRAVAVAATSGTSVRGRPFGSNRTRITKLKQTHGDAAENLFAKCSIKGCAFRFKKSETVEYHRKCHDMSSDSPQAMLCPECKSTEYTNWNTLHTHLWRAHQIDMELYKCELCEFKTPIFSRLVNTHAKIHFDDRNYKCEQCEKAFKNSKQLKNHRRWHRVQAAAASTTPTPKEPPTEIHRCSDCGSTFSQQKTLREHCCKKGESSLKCNICEKSMSSKASLKLHLLTHSDGAKRYKCQNCDYSTNDHNAFRRHRMGHENKKMYVCSFCPYTSVQSVAYQKHILQKHPEKADSVIHKCNVCSFSTINRSLLVVHQAKHEKSTDEVLKTNNLEDVVPNVNVTEKSVSVVTDVQKSKIKVKSNLFTTDNETAINFNKNDVNLVQLYNIDNSIT